MSDVFTVRLTHQDADHLLALAEWALSQPTLICCPGCGEVVKRKLDLGPGLRESSAEAAARKIESVFEMARRGLVSGEEESRG